MMSMRYTTFQEWIDGVTMSGFSIADIESHEPGVYEITNGEGDVIAYYDRVVHRGAISIEILEKAA